LTRSVFEIVTDGGIVTTTVCDVAETGVLGGCGPLPLTDAVFVYDPTAPSIAISLCEHVKTRDSFACSDCGPDGDSVPESHLGSLSVTPVSVVGPAVTVIW
jgi:hypothetical protein